MTRLVSVSEIVPLRAGHGRVDDLLDAAVPARAERALAANDTGADLGNVVPFMRPRGNARVVPAVTLPTDAARLPRTGLTRERARLAAFITLSLAMHAGLFMAFWREPVPLASIGVEVISVEIVVGATAPAGAAVTQGEQQVNAAAAPETEATQVEQAETRATTQEQTVAVASQETAPEQKQTDVAKSEAPPDQKTETAKPEEPKYQTSAAPDEPAAAEQKPAVAMVETPSPDTATAKPQDTPPPPTEVTLLPQPEEKPTETKVERKPVQAAPPPKPVKDAKPAKEARRIAAPTRENASREAKASTPSTAANNFGIGRSNRDTNYPGIVRAHLARYKQPLGSSEGSATVSFTVSGSGGVAGVRLARGSGVAAIDQEVQAMVRRASPFPPPPDGRSQSFTVPVSFVSR